MERSGGVTVSAVIAMIGSVVSILFGVGVVLIGIAMSRTPDSPLAGGQAFPLTTVLALEGIVLLGFGVWGIASAVGLLRLRNWARISVIVYAAMLSVICVFSMLPLLLWQFVTPLPLPAQEGVPPGMMTAALVITIAFALALAALSVWWLVYFNRAKIKAQFVDGAKVIVPPRRPVTITVIAWLMMVGSLFLLVTLFGRYPAFVFGFLLEGWGGAAFYVIYGIGGLAVGIGLLRFKPLSHTLAVCYYGFGVLNAAATLLVPGSFARMQSFTQNLIQGNSALPTALVEQYFKILMVWALLFTSAILWILLSRRQAFIRACQSPAT